MCVNENSKNATKRQGQKMYRLFKIELQNDLCFFGIQERLTLWNSIKYTNKKYD